MSQPDLDKTFFHSVAWMAFARYFGQILRWCATILVVRLLTPDDYGIYGMSIVVVELIALLSEFALETAVVTLRDLSGRQLAQINTLCMLLGVLGVIVCAVIARPLAVFFDSPDLPPVILAMSAVLLIKPMQSVPMALLRKELRFKRLAIYEGIDALILPVASLLLAALGFRYWTLVIAYLLQNAVSVVLILSHRRHPFAWPRWADLKTTLRFALHVSIQRISWAFYNQADSIVGGRTLGQSPLGLYRVGLQMANKPSEQLAIMFSRVAPAFFAAVQRDTAALRRYFLRLTEGMALLGFAACLGLALVADSFVLVLFGEKWTLAIEPLRILAIFAAWRSIEPLFHQILIVRGEEKFGGQISLLAACVLPVAFYVGCQWGTVGLALAWVVAYPPVFLPIYVRVFRCTDLSLRVYLRAVWPALSCSIAMVVGVTLFKWLAGDVFRPLASFLFEIGIGAACYLGTLFLLHRERISAVLKLIRRAREGTPPVAASVVPESA